jgi:hypothetical protein
VARRANRALNAKPCPSLHTKIFRLTCRANQMFNFARLTADEGRLAIVTNVAVRCGGRGDHERRTWFAADGEVVWSWRPWVGVKLAMMLSHRADDGDNKAWSPGRARISRKTIAQGRPVDPARTCGSCPVHFFARGPWVRQSPGLPCALCLIEEGPTDATLGCNKPRDRGLAPRRCLTS